MLSTLTIKNICDIILIRNRLRKIDVPPVNVIFLNNNIKKNVNDQYSY